ncbi:MAG: fibrobacter succinogenes major paralogous domain-containing protein [Flavobacteriales bacterium]|nr:fibrobacter succinogenes major paralogous domain-containing protein [Flavobacteriales bacterium]
MPTVTDIDGNVYNTVQIGGQCWMMENLRTSTYRNNTPIPNVTDSAQWVNLASGAWCNFNNTANDAILGKLYNWYAVDNAAGLCPLGWHVPAEDDWLTLINHLGGSSVAVAVKLNCCTHFSAFQAGFGGTQRPMVVCPVLAQPGARPPTPPPCLVPLPRYTGRPNQTFWTVCVASAAPGSLKRKVLQALARFSLSDFCSASISLAAAINAASSKPHSA